MIRLTVAIAGQAEASYAFPGPEVHLGRSARNTLVVAHPTVSNRHAVLEQRSAGWVVVDLGSTNGTALDGTPLTAHVPVLLPAHATLLLGDVELRVAVGVDVPMPLPSSRRRPT